MEKVLFSNESQRLYNAAWQSDYEGAGDWPSDLQEVDANQSEQIRGSLNKGARVDFSDGVVTAVGGRPPVPVGFVLEQVKDELRAMRTPMLDALTGISGRAARAGNDALAAEADAMAEQLLDITDDVALNAASTREEMKAAGLAAYERIALMASTELAVVFREITAA